MVDKTADELDQNDKDQNEEIQEENSLLEMSDDDLENLSIEEIEALTASDAETTTTGDKDDDGNESDGESGSGTDDGTGSDDGSNDDGNDGSDGTGSDDAGSGSADDDGGESGSSTEGDSESGESGSGSDKSEDGDASDPGTTGEDGHEQDDESGESESASARDEVDYKAEHSKLLAPFRANGREMQVKSVDDARTLMQMGANYNKKMAGLKPNLKLIKMLDNNNLLSEEKLSFFIDLDKKDPEAVKKFIKESGVNLDEFDQDAEHNYKSNTYTVGDQEVNLDGVLEEIKDTPSFSETVDIVSNKWDESSRKVLIESPSLIKVINSHVETGVFDKITKAVEQERMLGRLLEVSDLDAYKHVGDTINAAGGFDQPGQSKTDSNTETTKQPTQKTKTVDSKVRDRKKAASSTKAAPSKQGNENFNPLALSDEEFEKDAASMNL